MIYNYPLNYLADIFNWILVLIMLFIGINLYSGRAEEFLNDILFILKISVVGHFIFVALQFLNTNTSLNFNYLLDLRFADSDMKYGHINRFTVGIGSYFAWVLNLGRIQSQFSRIKTLLDMFLFRASLNEASGRTVRWHGGVNYLFDQNKDIFGLMANPGHAFPGDPIDSYYLIMLVQGGPILVVFFSILMFILLRKSLKIYT